MGLTSVDCIVQELETAETAAVTQLLTEILLDEPAEAAGAVLGQGSKETGGGVMKMVAVSPEARNRTKKQKQTTGQACGC